MQIEPLNPDLYRSLKIIGVIFAALILLIAIVSRHDPARTIADINRDAKAKAWQDSLIKYECCSILTQKEAARKREIQDSLAKYGSR